MGIVDGRLHRRVSFFSLCLLDRLIASCTQLHLWRGIDNSGVAAGHRQGSDANVVVGRTVGTALRLSYCWFAHQRFSLLSLSHHENNTTRGNREETGAAPPIAMYGALNAVLFATYNRSLAQLAQLSPPPGDAGSSSSGTATAAIWTAGAIGGLATSVISTPSELVKCRAQLSSSSASSWSIARELVATHGLRGLYIGGVVTSLRDAVGYGFYFAVYHAVRQGCFGDGGGGGAAVLVAGGIAGMATWASVYPLDVVKTRVQAQALPSLSGALSPPSAEGRPLLGGSSRSRAGEGRMWHGGYGARACARMALAQGGWTVFFDGLGIWCVSVSVLLAASQVLTCVRGKYDSGLFGISSRTRSLPHSL